MTEKKRVFDIELELTGQVKDRFLQIKRVKGLADDAEVLRFIINDYFEKKLADRPTPPQPKSKVAV